MAAFIENSRRAPRVPIVLETDVVLGYAVWQAVTVDFGTGGCLLLPGRAIDEHARLVLEVHTDDLPDHLTVTGWIAWQAGLRCGIRFGRSSRGLPPHEWFLQLLAHRPHLQERVARSPSRLTTDALASRRSGIDHVMRLTSDEERVLSHVRQRTPIHVVQHHARLPPHYFVRAFFSLLEKGLVVVGQSRALTSVDLVRNLPASNAESER